MRLIVLIAVACAACDAVGEKGPRQVGNGDEQLRRQSPAEAQGQAADTDAGSEGRLVEIEPSANLGLQIEFSAGGWLPRLGGNVTLGPSPAAGPLALATDLDLDSLTGVPSLELAIRRDRWQLELSGFDFSTSSQSIFADIADYGSIALNPGDPISTSFEITSGAGELAYWKWWPCRNGAAEPQGSAEDPPTPPTPPAPCAVDLRFAPAIGLRYLHAAHTIKSLGATERAGGEWVSPYIGLRIHIAYELPTSFPLFDRLEINGSVGAGPALGGSGGGGAGWGGWAAHIRAGITGYVHPNVGLTFGYRLIHLNVENDDFEFDGGLQGLFFGASVKF